MSWDKYQPKQVKYFRNLRGVRGGGKKKVTGGHKVQIFKVNISVIQKDTKPLPG
jgi:hypothetical protein